MNPPQVYYYYYFCNKLSNCLPKWLYHFAFIPAVNEGSGCPSPYQHFMLSVFCVSIILIGV